MASTPNFRFKSLSSVRSFFRTIRQRPANSNKSVYAEMREIGLSQADFNVLVKIILSDTVINDDHCRWLKAASDKETLKRYIMM